MAPLPLLPSSSPGSSPGAPVGLPTGRMLRVRRAVLARRRLLSAALAALAVLATVRAVQDPVGPAEPVVVAAHDLQGGRPLTDDDVRVVRLAREHAPAGATRDPEVVVGRVLAAPVRAGEAVTDVRLVAPGLLDGYPGRVAAPVRLADSGSVGLLRVGDTVEVLAADPGGSTAEVLVRAPVLALPDPGGPADDVWSQGALVLLAVPAEDAARLAQAGATRVLSVALVR